MPEQTICKRIIREAYMETERRKKAVIKLAPTNSPSKARVARRAVAAAAAAGASLTPVQMT